MGQGCGSLAPCPFHLRRPQRGQVQGQICQLSPAHVAPLSLSNSLLGLPDSCKDLVRGGLQRSSPA